MVVLKENKVLAIFIIVFICACTIIVLKVNKIRDISVQETSTPVTSRVVIIDAGHRSS